MFESLSERLQAVFQRLGGKGKLSAQDVEDALREVRLALLEADVNFKVVRSFVANLRERATGAAVLQSLTPAQQVIKLVNEELIAMLGGGASRLELSSNPPTVVMLAGLQGSGKTTTVAKLALYLRKQGRRPLMVAADVYRPAAIDQLVALGKQIDIPVYAARDAKPVAICRDAVAQARARAQDVVLLDTAGRLHVDEVMMAEVAEIQAAVKPHEVLLVADAMTGQDAVRVAEEFHSRLALTGLILTKMDGDARGGAALSIKSVTGVPIKFIGVGEKVDALEPFYPDRLASRILGMGDVLSLIERAQQTVDVEQTARLQKKMRQATFDLQDFLDQLQQVRKMGPLGQLLEMIPGMNRLTKMAGPAAVDERQLARVEAIIRSMTPAERANPRILDGSRKRRIARGSGTTQQDVNQLLNQFNQMRDLMKHISSGKMPKHLRRLMR